MFSISSASRRPVRAGQVMVIARSDPRADMAAWATRLRRTHPAGCRTIADPTAVWLYFDKDTTTTQGREFLIGLLEELRGENAEGKSIDHYFSYQLMTTRSDLPAAIAAASSAPAPAPAVVVGSSSPVTMTTEELFRWRVGDGSPGSGRVGAPGAVFDPVAAAGLAPAPARASLVSASVSVSVSSSVPAVAVAAGRSLALGAAPPTPVATPPLPPPAPMTTPATTKKGRKSKRGGKGRGKAKKEKK
ncbi:MAG: hypothetical protein M1826_003426 [Phylliscum demangeonii]|nr:MAG: hypothetical protein M1826_003426 [Phylliscum demangeonii]